MVLKNGPYNLDISKMVIFYGSKQTGDGDVIECGVSNKINPDCTDPLIVKLNACGEKDSSDFTLFQRVVFLKATTSGGGCLLNEFVPGAELIMFGSRARGEDIPSSDYDLLVIARDTLTDRQRLHFQAQIRKALAKKLILADIIIQSRDDIRKKQKLPGHIIRAAMKEGVRV